MTTTTPSRWLYYLFAAEHPGAFSWEPQEDGPVVWRVRIGRTVTAGRARSLVPARGLANP